VDTAKKTGDLARPPPAEAEAAQSVPALRLRAKSASVGGRCNARAQHTGREHGTLPDAAVRAPNDPTAMTARARLLPPF